MEGGIGDVERVTGDGQANPMYRPIHKSVSCRHKLLVHPSHVIIYAIRRECRPIPLRQSNPDYDRDDATKFQHWHVLEDMSCARVRPTRVLALE